MRRSLKIIRTSTSAEKARVIRAAKYIAEGRDFSSHHKIRRFGSDHHIAVKGKPSGQPCQCSQNGQESDLAENIASYLIVMIAENRRVASSLLRSLMFILVRL